MLAPESILSPSPDDEETILSEDPTPAETTHQGNEKPSTVVILAGVIAVAAVIVTSIIVAGIIVVCKHRPKPPDPQEVRKRMRVIDGFEE
uniref:Uncharacterized protein n=1 Tax=Megaselia scalaris TaxID=36166 RepID=T1GSL3_MEGSC